METILFWASWSINYFQMIESLLQYLDCTTLPWYRYCTCKKAWDLMGMQIVCFIWIGWRDRHSVLFMYAALSEIKYKRLFPVSVTVTHKIFSQVLATSLLTNANLCFKNLHAKNHIFSLALFLSCTAVLYLSCKWYWYWCLWS